MSATGHYGNGQLDTIPESYDRQDVDTRAEANGINSYTSSHTFDGTQSQHYTDTAIDHSVGYGGLASAHQGDAVLLDSSHDKKAKSTCCGKPKRFARDGSEKALHSSGFYLPLLFVLCVATFGACVFLVLVGMSPTVLQSVYIVRVSLALELQNGID